MIQDIYLLHLGGLTDRLRFASENHWGYFPSGAFSWKFKNEKFLKNNNVLSDGKFRASYGTNRKQ